VYYLYCTDLLHPEFDTKRWPCHCTDVLLFYNGISTNNKWGKLMYVIILYEFIELVNALV